MVFVTVRMRGLISTIVSLKYVFGNDGIEVRGRLECLRGERRKSLVFVTVRKLTVCVWK